MNTLSSSIMLQKALVNTYNHPTQDKLSSSMQQKALANPYTHPTRTTSLPACSRRPWSTPSPA